VTRGRGITPYNSIYSGDFLPDDISLTYEELLSLDNRAVPTKQSMNAQLRQKLIKKGTRSVVWSKGKLKSDECVICLEPLGEKGKAVTAMKCDHAFHKKCLQQWFKVDLRCPTCRTGLETKD